MAKSNLIAVKGGGWTGLLKGSLTRENLLVLLLGFCLGRAAIPGWSHPLALAFLGAARGTHREKTILAGISLIVGMGTTGGFLAVMVQGLLFFAFLVGYGLLEKRGPEVWIGPVLVGCGAGASFWFPFLPLHLLLGVSLSVTSYYLLRRGLEQLLPKNGPLDSGDDWLPAIGVLGLAMLGLGGVGIGTWNLANFCTVFLVLGASRVGGPGAGAGMGVGLGTVGLLGQGGGLAYLAVQGVAGLLAGFFREFGRWAGVLAYLAGNLLLTASFPELGKTLLETVATVTLAAAIPDSWWERASEGLFPGAKQKEREVVLPRRLQHLAGLFGGLARTIRREPGENKGEGVPWMCATVVEQVCQSCPSFHRCWRLSFYRTYQHFLDLLVLGEEGGGLLAGKLPQGMEKGCHRHPEVLAAINVLREAGRRYQGWEERVLEARRLVSDQLLGVAGIMESLATEATDAWEGARPRLLRLGFLQGAASRPKGNNQVSGDSYLVRPLGHRLVIALSDGMGSGTGAAAESRAALSLLEGMLTAGFSPQLAVKSVNAALNLREAESFVTLDLAVVDLETGVTDFGKIGAVNSFLIRGRRVTTITGPSPPAGILREVEPAWHRMSLHSGDILVLTSDGLGAYPGDEDRIPSYIQRIGIREPGSMAQRIVEAALAEAGGEAEDDATVLVVHFLPALKEKGR